MLQIQIRNNNVTDHDMAQQTNQKWKPSTAQKKGCRKHKGQSNELPADSEKYTKIRFTCVGNLHQKTGFSGFPLPSRKAVSESSLPTVFRFSASFYSFPLYKLLPLCQYFLLLSFPSLILSNRVFLKNNHAIFPLFCWAKQDSFLLITPFITQAICFSSHRWNLFPHVLWYEFISCIFFLIWIIGIR